MVNRIFLVLNLFLNIVSASLQASTPLSRAAKIVVINLFFDRKKLIYIVCKLRNGNVQQVTIKFTFLNSKKTVLNRIYKNKRNCLESLLHF